MLNAAVNLLEEEAKVGAILGAETSLEAKFLAEFGERNKIPVISFSKPTNSFPISTRSHFFVQVGRDDQATQVKGIVALIELYKWRNVILIHDQEIHDLDHMENDDDAMSYIIAVLLEEKKMPISFVSSITASPEDDQIIEQLCELKTLQTTVFVVHLSHSIASRLFVHAERLGMISKGYAWIVTSKSMDHFKFNSRDSSNLQGVLGFRSYIPASNQPHNFTSRFDADMAPDAMQLNLGLLAYDVAWSLAKAVERIMVKVSKSNSLDLNYTYIYRSMFVQEMLRSSFKGLGGEFRFINGKLFSNNMFEIVNVMGSSGAKKELDFARQLAKLRGN